ncbi:hypothetical protein LCM00_21160 [Bacillus infantis]|uniref:hypothetical protein n=1 Tax=Bacillus infantis TaxID=324767 RepID=UPI001CD458AD|nr:hypothetical protein [Bacillus infantis]MCA1042012.1 hypothetical protein [Bacillus infantis]
MAEWKKKLLASGLAGGLILSGLTACGDGVDQDNGPSDGEQQDEMDDENQEDIDMEEEENEENEEE